MNPLINADIICLFGHFDCILLSVLPNFGKSFLCPFLKYCIPSFHNIPLDVFINTYME